jgi:chaperonin GroES
VEPVEFDLVPKQNFVYALLDPPEDTTASGLFLPGEQKYKITRARVVATGPKVIEVAIDDHIMFSQYSGIEVDTDEGKYILIKQPDILAVLGD